MDNISITFSNEYGFTLLPNIFIDKYMASSNGEYIKVFLCLLRYIGQDSRHFSVSSICDFLDKEESDVIRALNYWDKMKVLKLSKDTAGKITSICLLNITPAPVCTTLDTFSSVSDPDNNVPVDYYSKKEDREFINLIFIVEKYFGRPVRPTETDILLNLCYGLNIPHDLIEYICCYAVERKHISMRYVEATAIAWLDEGITTVKDADEYLKNNNDTISSVMKAFGLGSRLPGTAEQDYIVKWSDTFGFDNDIIVEACNRARLNTGGNSGCFRYADAILSSWHKGGVRTVDDIKKMDDKFEEESSKKTASSASKKKNASAPMTKLHNFEQRSYDFDDLEARIEQYNDRNHGE